MRVGVRQKGCRLPLGLSRAPLTCRVPERGVWSRPAKERRATHAAGPLAEPSCSLLVPVPGQAQVGPPDPEVAKGMREVEEGEYDAAILTLDGAARRLAAAGGQSTDLVQSHLYLGVAYLAKGHETAARASFREALTQFRDLRVSPEKFAPRVIEVFEQARRENAQETAARAATATPVPAPSPAAKKGGSRARGLQEWPFESFSWEAPGCRARD